MKLIIPPPLEQFEKELKKELKKRKKRKKRVHRKVLGETKKEFSVKAGKGNRKLLKECL